MEPTDRELLERIRAGDRDASERFARRHAAWMVDYARRRGAGDQAEDVAQTVLGNLLQRPLLELRRATAAPALKTWVSREILKLHRPESPLENHSSVIDPATSPSAAAARAQILDRVAEDVAALDTIKRRLFALRYVEGLDASEIESVTGRPAGSVRKELSRIRAALRTTEPHKLRSSLIRSAKKIAS